MQNNQTLPQVVSPADVDGNVLHIPLVDANKRTLAVEFAAEDNALHVAISLQDSHNSHLQDISLVSVQTGNPTDGLQNASVKVWTDPDSDAYTKSFSIPAYTG